MMVNLVEHLRQECEELLLLLESLEAEETKKVELISLLSKNGEHFEEAAQVKENEKAIEEIMNLNAKLIEQLFLVRNKIDTLVLEINKLVHNKEHQFSELPVTLFTYSGSFAGLGDLVQKVMQRIEAEVMYIAKLINSEKGFKKGFIWNASAQLNSIIQNEQVLVEGFNIFNNYERVIFSIIEGFDAILYSSKRATKFVEDSTEFVVGREAVDITRQTGKKDLEITQPLVKINVRNELGSGGQKKVFSATLDKGNEKKVAIGYLKSYFKKRDFDDRWTEEFKVLFSTLGRLKYTPYLQGIARPEAIVFFGPRRPAIITPLCEYFGSTAIRTWMKKNDPIKVIAFFIRLFYECSHYKIYCVDAHVDNTGITDRGEIKSIDAGLVASLGFELGYQIRFMPLGLNRAIEIDLLNDQSNQAHIADIINMGLLYWSLVEIGLSQKNQIYTSNQELASLFEHQSLNAEQVEEAFKEARVRAKSHLEKTIGFELAQLLPPKESIVAKHLQQQHESFKKLKEYYASQIENPQIKDVLSSILSYLTPFVFEERFKDTAVPQLIDLLPAIAQLPGNESLSDFLKKSEIMAEKFQNPAVLENQVIFSPIGAHLNIKQERERKEKVMENLYTPLADVQFSDALKLLHLSEKSSSFQQAVNSVVLKTLSEIFLKIMIILGAYQALGEPRTLQNTPLLPYLRQNMLFFSSLQKNELLQLMALYGLDSELFVYLSQGIDVLRTVSESKKPEFKRLVPPRMLKFG